MASSCLGGLWACWPWLGLGSPRTQDLQGIRVLVTGASEGIGVAIVEALAAKGVSKIAIAARRRAKLQEVRIAVLAQHPGIEVLVVEADVGRADDCESLAQRVLTSFGGCELLVNNAGVPGVMHFEHARADKIDQVLDINLKGAMQLARCLVPSMIAAGRGHIVNVASLAGKGIEPFNSVYAASKYGMVGWSKALRAEMRIKATGITVHVVAPGFVTEAGMAADPSKALNIDKILATAMDAGGCSSPKDVADAVARAVEFDEPELIVNSPYAPVSFARKMGLDQLFPRRPDYMLSGPGFAPVLAWLKAVADGNLRNEQSAPRCK